MKNLQHWLWDITRMFLVFSFWLIYFEHERLWHPVPELNTLTHYSVELLFYTSWKHQKTLRLLTLILGQLIVVIYLGKHFLGKICINSRPLFIIFNHLFGCPEANFGPLRWQRIRLAYLILIIVLYLIWSKGDL